MVKINVNRHWTRQYRQSEVELVIIYNNRKHYILKCGTPLMDGRTLHKDPVTLEEKTPSEKLLSGKYYLPVYFVGNL